MTTLYKVGNVPMVLSDEELLDLIEQAVFRDKKLKRVIIARVKEAAA